MTCAYVCAFFSSWLVGALDFLGSHPHQRKRDERDEVRFGGSRGIGYIWVPPGPQAPICPVS